MQCCFCSVTGEKKMVLSKGDCGIKVFVSFV